MTRTTSLIFFFAMACGGPAAPVDTAGGAAPVDTAGGAHDAEASSSESANDSSPVGPEAGTSGMAHSISISGARGPWVSDSDALGFHVINLWRGESEVGCASLDRGIHGSRVASFDESSDTVRLWLRPDRIADAPTPPEGSPSCPEAFPPEGPSDGILSSTIPAVLDCTFDEGDLVCASVRFRSVASQVHEACARDWWNMGQRVRAIVTCSEGCEVTAPAPLQFASNPLPGAITVDGTIENILRYLHANPTARLEEVPNCRSTLPEDVLL